MPGRSHLFWVVFKQFLPGHEDSFGFTYAFAEAATYQAEERLCHPNSAILIAFIDLAGADFQAGSTVITEFLRNSWEPWDLFPGITAPCAVVPRYNGFALLLAPVVAGVFHAQRAGIVLLSYFWDVIVPAHTREQ